MLYVARQEGFEEMAEELFQDGVKQVASAYGALINTNKLEKEDTLQYLMMVILKMQSVTLPGVAGAIGGPMGGHKVDLSPITSASSMTDILMDGRKKSYFLYWQK
jgi:hypothetical protein